MLTQTTQWMATDPARDTQTVHVHRLRKPSIAAQAHGLGGILSPPERSIVSALLWNTLYPEGTKVAAYPGTLTDEPLLTITRSREKGWRAPAGARYVGRGTRWGSPYRLGQTLVRYPGIHGAEWEQEGRLSRTVGEQHHYRHPDGTITWHQVEYATAEQVVDLYRAWLTTRPELIADARKTLVDRDLMCWCPLRVPCPTDVLLEVINT